MEMRDYMDLLELQLRIKEGVADAFPDKYWVKAEISSWSPRANGHCYLSLSQSRGGKPVAESRAMIWKWHYPQLKAFFEKQTGQQLQAGITVLVRVQVSFSELYGISLFIDDINPAFTLGEKALERKRAIEKLTAQGYMEMQKELVLPELPYRLAVITSKTAAGYQDFRNHLLNNPEGYVLQLDLCEALMQGEQAPASIISALLELQEKQYDAILILRGGGSELDLSCFDDYDLAVAIATCPVPVITAIGHDKDVHIADMVAGGSVKTPTALADLFLDAYRAQDEVLRRFQQRVFTGAERVMNRAQLALKALDGNIQRAVERRFSGMEKQVGDVQARIRLGLTRKLAAGENLLQRSGSGIARGLLHKYTGVARLKDNVAHRIQFAATARAGEGISALALMEARIKSTDPRSILALGYVLVTGKDNKVMKTVAKVSRGDRIGVRFSDGSLTALVDQVYSEKLENDKVNIA